MILLQRLTFIVYVGLLVWSCGPSDYSNQNSTTPTTTPDCLVSGDIIVSTSGNDSLIAFNSDGTFKRLLKAYGSASATPYGMSYLASTGELLVAVDGGAVNDRVEAIKLTDCSVRTLILDANLSGNLKGLTVLSTGELLIVETSNVEKYTTANSRVTTGTWPKALQTTASGIYANSTGGFVHCSAGNNVVRTYNSSGTQVATTGAAPTGATAVYDCRYLSDGSVVASRSGTTDYVEIYNSALSSTTMSYSNSGYIQTPTGVAQAANGNILVLDQFYNYVVELTTAGVLVQTFGAGYLSTPEYIFVIP